jgi:Fe-S cluster assembly ATP-binding protein
MNALTIDNLTVAREGNPVLHDVSLSVKPGELHALMGPNGSGKSSLAKAVMGHPKYAVTSGTIVFDGDDITALGADVRSRKGLFLSLQEPPAIPGVSVTAFLRAAVNARREKPVGVAEFHKMLKAKMSELGIDPSFAGRNLNEGFSGGEKKRMEMLQLAMLAPKYAILDETEAGLDVDARKTVIAGIRAAREQGTGIILITHDAALAKELGPDGVHVLSAGRIVASGGSELADRIGKEGYSAF